MITPPSRADRSRGWRDAVLVGNTRKNFCFKHLETAVTGRSHNKIPPILSTLPRAMASSLCSRCRMERERFGPGGGMPRNPCRNVRLGMRGGGDHRGSAGSSPLACMGAGQASHRVGLQNDTCPRAGARAGHRNGPVADLIVLFAVGFVPECAVQGACNGHRPGCCGSRFAACRMRTSSGKVRAVCVLRHPPHYHFPEAKPAHGPPDHLLLHTSAVCRAGPFCVARPDCRSLRAYLPPNRKFDTLPRCGARAVSVHPARGDIAAPEEGSRPCAV